MAAVSARVKELSLCVCLWWELGKLYERHGMVVALENLSAHELIITCTAVTMHVNAQTCVC